MSILQFPVAGQNGFSGNLGVGMGGVNFSESHFALNFNGAICYRDSNLIYDLSQKLNDEFVLFTRPIERLTQIEAKIGGCYDYQSDGFIFPFFFIYIKDINYSFRYKTGLTYIKYTKRTDKILSDFMNDRYNTKNYFGFGIPLEVELRQEVFSYFGLSASGFINLNSVKSYFGFNTGIYIGVL